MPFFMNETGKEIKRSGRDGEGSSSMQVVNIHGLCFTYIISASAKSPKADLTPLDIGCLL